MTDHRRSAAIIFWGWFPLILAGCAPGFFQGPAPTQSAFDRPTTGPSPGSNVPVAPVPANEDLQDNPDLYTWEFSGDGLTVISAFITRYGRHLVIVFEEGMLMVHNFMTDEKQVFKPPVDFAFLDFENGISSNAAGILLAEYLLNEGGNVALWQVSSEESRVTARIIEPEYFLTSLAVSPDGETLALGYNNGEIRLFRTGDGTPIHAIQAHYDFVMSLAFSWDGRLLLSDSCCFDPYAYVFDAGNGSKTATLATESYEPGRISFSPDNQLAAVTSYDGTHIHSTRDWSDLGFVIPTFEGSFTCDSKGVIVKAEDRIDIYSVTTGVIIRTRPADEMTPTYCLYDGRAATLDWNNKKDMVTLQIVEPYP